MHSVMVQFTITHFSCCLFLFFSTVTFGKKRIMRRFYYCKFINTHTYHSSGMGGRLSIDGVLTRFRQRKNGNKLTDKQKQVILFSLWNLLRLLVAAVIVFYVVLWILAFVFGWSAATAISADVDDIVFVTLLVGFLTLPAVFLAVADFRGMMAWFRIIIVLYILLLLAHEIFLVVFLIIQIVQGAPAGPAPYPAFWIVLDVLGVVNIVADVILQALLIFFFIFVRDYARVPFVGKSRDVLSIGSRAARTPKKRRGFRTGLSEA